MTRQEKEMEEGKEMEGKGRKEERSGRMLRE
jgi:hypothetical protein